MGKGAVSASLLAGCRVLDLSDEKGAFCGRSLGDLGADVIVVEPPGGCSGRRIGPFYKDERDPQKSLYWFYVGANKRGITLNLERPEGREILLRLVDTADILVESGPPGRMAALGLGFEDLHRRKPSLVVTSITPFGQTGPYRHYVADDLVLTAMGGMVRIYGYLDSPPLRITAPQAYFQGSLHGAMASALAYYHAGGTGEGQHVDVSIQEAVSLALMRAAEVWDMLKSNLRGIGPFQIQPRPAPQTSIFLRWIFPVADGYIIAMLGGGANAAAVRSSRKIVQMANAEGYALEYADFVWEAVDLSTITQEEIDHLYGAIGDWFRVKTKAELFTAALSHGLLLAPISTPDDIGLNPQLVTRDFWVAVEHDELGAVIPYPGGAAKVPGAPWAVRRRAPLIGEHNGEIFEGELGLAANEVAVLREKGVI